MASHMAYGLAIWIEKVVEGLFFFLHELKFGLENHLGILSEMLCRLVDCRLGAYY